MRWLPVLLCLATPVVAEVPDRETLEEPGRIWLRDTLHPSAELGLVVPFFSFVKFEDGAFEYLLHRVTNRREYLFDAFD